MEERQYRVIETLGEGGFGTVFRAEMLSAGGFAKQVALKVLHVDRGLPDEVALRLRDEARMLGHVRHRAVVGVDGLAHLDEGWAVVMEYIDGVDAKDLLSRGPTPVRVALEIVEEAASALHAAYFARPLGTDTPLRLVHRDIKPANLRITPAGEVKVLDFGVARADFGSREAHTQSMMYGTLTYMAPERIEGDSGPEGDVFALGLVLLDLLTGEDRSEAPPPTDARLKRFLETRFDRIADILDEREPVIGAAERETMLELIRKMLSLDERRRPTARDVERQVRTLRASVPGPWLRDWAEEHVPELKAARHSAREQGQGRVLRVHSDSIVWDHDATPKPGGQAAPLVQPPPPLVQPPPPLSSVPPQPQPPPSGVQSPPPLVQPPPLLVQPPPSFSAHSSPQPVVPVAPVPEAQPRRLGIAIGVAVSLAIVAVGLLLLRPGEGPASPAPAPILAPVEAVVPKAAAPTEVAPVATPAPAPAAVAPAAAPAEEPKTARTAATPRKATEKSTEKAAPVASKTGHVTVSGDATHVTLVSGGNSLAPGDVPAGTYTVMATFEGGEATAAGVVDVKVGETTKVYCSATFSRCGVR